MEDFISRFRYLINNLEISNSRFADELGVQRSSISHIISGRNKPGFDFIEKIVNTYPQVNADWLITGRGSVFISNFGEKTANTYNSGTSPSGEERSFELEKEKDAVMSRNVDTIHDKHHDKSIETVIVLYKDGSFREFYH